MAVVIRAMEFIEPICFDDEGAAGSFDFDAERNTGTADRKIGLTKAPVNGSKKRITPKQCNIMAP
jgi:hypothetical protein